MVERIMRWGFVLLMVLALSGFGVASAQSPTAQNASCEGLDAYAQSLQEVGAELAPALSESDDSDLFGWTSEQFTAVAGTIRQIREHAAQLEPPPVAESFHSLLLDELDLVANMFDTMSTAGVFGAFIYVEQSETLAQQVETAAAEIDTICDVDLMSVMEVETIEATPVGVSKEKTPVADDAELGSRANPIPVGETVRLDDDWELTVVAIEPDATDSILAADSYTDPPADGHQFFVATVRVIYTGDASDTFSSWRLRAVGQSAVAYDQFTDSCGWSVPNALPDRELFTGGMIEGNICWSIDSTDADSLVLYDGDQRGDDRVFLSLMPAMSNTGATSPVATPNSKSSRDSKGS